MKILITGANGFIGKNLVAHLKTVKESQKEKYEIFCFTRESTKEELDRYTRDCDFVFHLAGVNRPKNEQEFSEGNVDLTRELVTMLEGHGNSAPVVLTSSTQAILDNPYGISKCQAELLIFEHGARMSSEVYVYRLPNVFGKWSRPNYNTVVATFCYNIARNLPIQVNNPAHELTLVYIDDILDEFMRVLEGEGNQDRNETGLSVEQCRLEGSVNLKSEKGMYVEENSMTEAPKEEHWKKIGNYRSIPISYKVTLGRLAELISSFPEQRKTLEISNMEDGLEKKLYSMYLSYLPENEFSYPLTMHEDVRGSFTEFIRTPERGQVSINVSKPGITKGNHWHHTKNEKFLVVKGQALIRFRKIGQEQVIEYYVSSDKLEVVDIPTGYTHSITNVGTQDLVTVMWANEPFDPAHPDTYFEEVLS